MPEFAGKVVPPQGNVVALRPPQTYIARPMSHTTGVQRGDDFEYMIQGPNDGRLLICGGRDLAHPRGYTATVREWDDSTTMPEIIQALQDLPNKHMSGWNVNPTKILPRFAWSGIMGLTSDELPFVGEVPSRQGQFMAAGYSGHGMARAFLTIRALLQGFLGEEIDQRVPLEYFRIRERLARRDTSWEAILRQNLKTGWSGSNHQGLVSKL